MNHTHFLIPSTRGFRSKPTVFVFSYLAALFLASKSLIICRLATFPGKMALKISYQILVWGLFVLSFLTFRSFLGAFQTFFIKTQNRWAKILNLSKLEFSGIFGAVLFFLFFPGIFLFLKSPLLAKGWELQDTVVSQLVFWPELGVVQTELLKRGNFLWSNLQGMGVPILGNDVQAAPLYPLTLALIWLPEQLFWNAFVTLRMVLMGTASILIALRVLQLNRIPSLFFTLCLIYNLSVTRWMNHAWQNGLLAGLWSIYFLHSSLSVHRRDQIHKKVSIFLGLTLSIYGLFTCGFPESTAMSALLVFWVGSPLVMSALCEKGSPKIRILACFILPLLLATALASPQFFALVEFIDLVGRKFREANGTVQYGSVSQLFFWITPFLVGKGNATPPHFFGLIPLFFFFVGIFDLIKKCIKSKLPDRFEFGALLVGAFYIFKIFPLWPSFNRWIGSLPILSQSWFLIYFFPLMGWFFAFFSAKGFQGILLSKKKNLIDALLPLFCVVVLLFVASPIASNKTYFQVLSDGEFSLSVAFLFGLAFVTYSLINTVSLQRLKPEEVKAIGALIFSFSVIEIVSFTPRTFQSISYDTDPEFGWEMAGRRLTEWFRSNAISLSEIRVFDKAGSLAKHDLPSPDMGAVAILTERMAGLRENLFVTEWEGYTPFRKGKLKYSWSLISNPFFLSQDQGWQDIKALNCPDCVLEAKLGDGIQLIRNTTALPRAYVASRCFLASSSQEALSKITDELHFNLGDVYLEMDQNKGDPGTIDVCSRTSGITSRVPIVLDQGSKLRLEPIRGPAVVVINDSFYPGWHAFETKSGSEIKIYPANYGFRGLVLPNAHIYSIELRYHPKWLTTASFLVIGGLVIVFGLIIFACRSLHRSASA